MENKLTEINGIRGYPNYCPAWLKRVYRKSVNYTCPRCKKHESICGTLQIHRKNDKIKNNVFYTKRFGEIITTFTGKSLIFQLPILKFKNSEIAVAEAGRIANSLKEKYEYEVQGLKLGTRDVSAQLISQHHAIPQEPYAKFCSSHGISYRDDYIDIDSSDTPELEFTDSKDSHIHHERYVEHTKDIILNEVPKISEITLMLKEITLKLNQQAELNKETSAGLSAITEFLKTQYKQQPVMNIEKNNFYKDYIN